jgi:isoleucyl-tRNA synthetase
VALELALDDELTREGLAREVVHAVQAARKAAGLDVSDRIVLSLAGDEVILGAVRAHQDYVGAETLATTVAFDDRADSAPRLTIDGRELRIAVARA